MTPATTAALTLNNGVILPALGLGVFRRPPEETAADTAPTDAERRRLDSVATTMNVQGARGTGREENA
jgi:hypothetical protein